MTSDPYPDAYPAGGDPGRLLADLRHLTHRVRAAQRVTWLPLLALAVVMFAAIPFARYGVRVDRCGPPAGSSVLRACRFQDPAALVYWPVALLAAYATVAYGYLRVTRARGLGGRVVPYAIAGVALIALFTAVQLVVVHRMAAPDHPSDTAGSTAVLFRLIEPPGAIGLALLVLAWLERHLALLLFTAGYLAVVLVPIDFGWGSGWGVDWRFAPQAVIDGGVLLLGALGFAAAQRPWRHR
jgi:hypothetical protein